MFSLPSPRRLTTPALLFFIVVASIRLYLRLTDLLKVDIFHHIIIESSARSSYNFSFEAALSPSLSLQDRFLQQYHSHAGDLPSNPHVVRMLSGCTHRPNPHTGHIRLSNVQVLNISMVPAAAAADPDEFKNNKYFNPAILPLPSYVSSSSSTPYQYLLISRLVTSGTHQESHICFATICDPSGSASLSLACSDADIALLGLAGGMRCVTKPEKINIPPTPAKKCTGAWKIFPDIPGFHDPRVFWSGRGEPLIEVNSGSAYGCIGLWMQDLRKVFEPLEKALRRTGHEHRDGNEEEGQEIHSKKTHFDISAARIGYPRLTELTRNPRESRADVEKNWIVFFPSEDEMWVQYNAMGQAMNEAYQKGQGAGQGVGATELLSSHAEEEIASSSAENSVLIDLDGILGPIALQKLPPHNYSTPHYDRRKPYDRASILDPDLATHSNPSPVSFSILATHKNPPRNRLDSPSSDPTTDLKPITPRKPPSNPPPQPRSHLTPSPGRTLSHLTSHALTTQNLTSPFEPPCFNLSSQSHTTDPLNNTGHWHQGTNSLRLILCTRSDFRARTCMSPDHSPLHPADVKTHSRLQYEEHLRSEGAIVHFSIIHRKFSNEIDLPMRYERYVLVWEARTPFRVVGVSRWPVVFGGERVRPWSYEEDTVGARRDGDLGLDPELNEDEDKSDESKPYFTYTPSIAWSHRAKDEDDNVHRERGHENLGTGYLGDEVIVGIGMDDVAQGFVRVEVGELMGCLRFCEGV